MSRAFSLVECLVAMGVLAMVGLLTLSSFSLLSAGVANSHRRVVAAALAEDLMTVHYATIDRKTAGGASPDEGSVYDYSVQNTGVRYTWQFQCSTSGHVGWYVVAKHTVTVRWSDAQGAHSYVLESYSGDPN